MKKGKISNRTADLIESCKEEELGSLKVDSVAEKLGVNASYLSRKFKSDKNMPLNDFITGVKMLRCARILSNGTEISIYSLAKKMGFARADYFVTLFRSRYGIHPKAYARLKKDQDMEKLDNLGEFDPTGDDIFVVQSCQD